MSYLNYEFFDEFKALDNLCRDIYGESADNKLGVTLYLEDMDKKAYRGTINVSGWASDYNRLKSARNIVAPIMNFGIFVTSAIQTAPSTNQSPPFTMSTMPMTNRKYIRNASVNMLSSLFKVMPP